MFALWLALFKTSQNQNHKSQFKTTWTFSMENTWKTWKFKSTSELRLSNHNKILADLFKKDAARFANKNWTYLERIHHFGKNWSACLLSLKYWMNFKNALMRFFLVPAIWLASEVRSHCRGILLNDTDWRIYIEFVAKPISLTYLIGGIKIRAWNLAEEWRLESLPSWKFGIKQLS